MTYSFLCGIIKYRLKELIFIITNKKITLSTGEEVTIRENNSKIYYNGSIFTNNKGLNFQIVASIDDGTYNYFVCRFEDGILVKGYSGNIKNGKIRNKNSKAFFGIGYIGYGEYNSENQKKECSLWCRMLRRCYSDEISQKYRAIVDERWHNFQNFCNDIKQLKGYDLWLVDSFKMHLDKDIICEKNKIYPKTYSRDTCMFISAEENVLESKYRNIESNLSGLTYIAIRIEDGYEEEFVNISEFARNNNLSQGHISSCISKKRKTHKGWSFHIKGGIDENIQ